ncbi:MAG: sigma-70 family RNA polymerase sigma factor [Anaerolineae bacterium]|nr:sigma-70 family RNA polymerase sigma factor [Anaerolineae bacterium]
MNAEYVADDLDVDAKLIQACREGKVNAWEQLLNRYERLVLSVPFHYGLGEDDAADVAQLAFTALLQNLHTLREDSNLKAWLCTIARRQSWRMLRRKQQLSLEEMDDEFDHNGAELRRKLLGDHLPNSIQHWEMVDWLQQGLSKLSGRCAQLLQALYFDEEQPSYADLAAQMKMPIGAIGPTRRDV